ncbi:autotransporter assembly complex protein TamA [Siccirubricoccus deserti]|uniref:Outer membrane protein assembly factor n=1 Tax=Siccirubricoccus deserti TaxID=2013562 RepID=A0A9X0QZI2_9PROT|nr:autotransporter assembly complex family protein [Siccirubricoccus deserti]MBC4016846.1 outer membrane protein assembly factor [Siccirubricoccus deserti]
MPPALRRLLPALLLMLAGLALAQEAAPPPEPAEVLPYALEIVPTGDDALDAALAASSQLAALREPAPTSAGGVIGRAEGDRERLQQALQSEGYWGGTTRIILDGQPLGSPNLLERLEASRTRPLPIRIEATPGERYRIASVTVRAADPAEAAAVAAVTATPFGLAPGDPARAAPVLAAERTLLDRLLAAGHPLATVANRETLVDHDRKSMEVAWHLAPGPAARFAHPVVEGATQVDQGFLQRQASRIAGEPYSPARLEQQRRDLMALGVFGSVRSRAAERLDQTGNLPVTFTVAERARHAVGFSAAYETNYGPSARVYWEHRNLFGGAERLRLEAEVARLGAGGGLDKSTYRIGASYRDPGALDRLLGPDWSLLGNAAALRERLDAYDRDAITASLLVERRVSERLSYNLGPVMDFGSIGPPDGKLDPYQIAGFQFGGRYDGADSLLDPSKGYRVSGTLTPSWSFRDSAAFAPLRVTGSTYFDLLGEKRGILAMRGTIGSLMGAGTGEVPRHQRYYAGGGGSVRGYDYQSIGPRDERNRPSGGASLLEASVEWRQRIWGDIGGVAFVDAGTVGVTSAPDFSSLRVGAGLGVRYYTAIGPIRADVALPLVRQPGSSGYGLYVGIGQAF